MGFFKSMRRSNSGITLIEILITMTIATVLMSIAIPSYKSLTSYNRIVSQTNSLVAAIHLARSEAIKRGVPVTVCKRINGQCDRTEAGWQAGWLVFMDANGNGLRNSGDTIIKQVDALSGSMTISGSSGAENRITFSRFGAAPGHTGTLTLCGSENNPSRANAINLSATGRISLATDSDDEDRIVENTDGENISCS